MLKKYKKLRQDPRRFTEIFSEHGTDRENLVPYESAAVKQIMAHYGEFRFEDEKSQSMVDTSGKTP